MGGGQAWISSFTKRAYPGESIDIPLAHKDALYVRSHYDGMSVMVPDAPLPDEIAVICCIANRGRLNHRRRRAPQAGRQGRGRAGLTAGRIGEDRMKTAIVNLATIVTGDWRDPVAPRRFDPDE